MLFDMLMVKISIMKKITSVFEKSKEGLEDARLKEIAISFYKQRNAAMGLKAAAQKAILFAVYCKGSTMHSRYRLDDGEFVDMVETPIKTKREPVLLFCCACNPK